MIFIIGLLLFNTTTVYAKVFTLQDVNNEFKNSSAAALLSLESKIVEDNVLNIYSEDLSIMSFNYHDNYLEYSNSEAITKENVDKEMLKSIVIVGVLETILKLNGYDENNMVLVDDIPEEELSTKFDEYGIEIKTEYYEFNEDTEDSHFHLSGDAIREVKISLDSDKITNFINKYGQKVEKEDDLIKMLVPKLEVKNITANSITLIPSLNLESISTDKEVMCSIYRASNKDDNYELIKESIDCNSQEGFIDENLQSDKTYYYKAAVVGGTNYSDILEVTTLNNKKIDDSIKKKEIDNPNTGKTIPIMIIGGITFIALLISLKKYNFISKL